MNTGTHQNVVRRVADGDRVACRLLKELGASQQLLTERVATLTAVETESLERLSALRTLNQEVELLQKENEHLRAGMCSCS